MRVGNEETSGATPTHFRCTAVKESFLRSRFFPPFDPDASIN